MPVPTDMVGDRIGPIRHEVDARWIMAYAAALGDTQDCYFDTRRERNCRSPNVCCVPRMASDRSVKRASRQVGHYPRRDPPIRACNS